MNERQNSTDSRILEVTKKSILTIRIPRHVIVKLPETGEKILLAARGGKDIQKDEDNNYTAC